ncbi:MAG: hypothetical protein ABSG93_03330 [Solirubrobacteraceae bacterium]|jgi:hypothetical protein
MDEATAIDAALEPAPRARRALADLIDTAVMALPAVLYWRRAWRARKSGQQAASPPRWTRALGPAVTVLGEQVGTPGAWIMGVRTVDRRTGRRIALWRTLAVALARVATQVLSRRLTPRPAVPSDAEHQQRRRQVEAIEARHPDDEDARNAELMRHYAEHRMNVTIGIWPPLAAALGSTLVNRSLRRRLAPTLVVSRRPAERPPSPHSP